MKPAEWPAVVEAIRAWAGDSFSDERAHRAYNDLSDLPAAQVGEAVNAWRMMNGERLAPSGPDLRRAWSYLAVKSPEPSEAAEQIREIFRLNRNRVGERGGWQKTLEDLATGAPLLAKISRRYGGPPPYDVSEFRRYWTPLLERSVEEERRRLVLNRLSPADLEALERQTAPILRAAA